MNRNKYRTNQLGGSGSNLGSQKIELSLKFLHVNKKALNGICLCLQVATFGLGQLRFTCLNILPEAEEKCSVPDLAKLDLPFIWSTSPSVDFLTLFATQGRDKHPARAAGSARDDRND